MEEKQKILDDINLMLSKIVNIKEYKKWSNIIYTDIAIDLNEDRACNENEIGEEDIIKSSDKLIDLIESDDYVNGYKVLNVLKFNDNSKALSLDKIYNNKITNKDIKSIVTKEQFESMKYKVVE